MTLNRLKRFNSWAGFKKSKRKSLTCKFIKAKKLLRLKPYTIMNIGNKYYSQKNNCRGKVRKICRAFTKLFLKKKKNPNKSF